ncbi:hypothetical protein SDC9_75699 [bioreactor metagenome]|uniref:Uncharacterized protein n=1 Tax=bioreactor metagenome TaxID=1076179 RepID=A0A644YLF1_9ZZZZ
MVAEEHHDHWGQQSDGDGQQQHDPKSFPVISHHLFVVACMPCGAMPGRTVRHMLFMLFVALGSGLFKLRLMCLCMRMSCVLF